MDIQLLERLKKELGNIQQAEKTSIILENNYTPKKVISSKESENKIDFGALYNEEKQKTR